MYSWNNNLSVTENSAPPLRSSRHHFQYTKREHTQETRLQGNNRINLDKELGKEEVEMFEQLIDKSTMTVSTKQQSSERVGDSAIYTYAKRVVDVAVTLIALICLLPLMVIIGVLVKLDSPGSALFVQKRVGCKRVVENGKVKWEIATFPMFKFRTMKQNADQSLHQAHIKAYAEGKLNGAEGNGAQFKLQEDPRITRLGKLLRKTSLDELPQLLNIFRGEMSLVGPRPVPEYEVAYYDSSHFERLEALPGMTGLWQVYGRGRVTFDEMMDMDIEYVRTRNLWLDIKLLLATVPAAVTGEGAK